MRKFLSAIVVAMLLFVSARSASGAELEPFYVCEGVTFGSKPYQVWMETRTKDALVVARVVDKNGSEAFMYGFRQKDKLILLLKVPGQEGVATYDIKKNTLKGQWTMAGAPSVQPETCKATETFEAPEPPVQIPEGHPNVDAGPSEKV